MIIDEYINIKVSNHTITKARKLYPNCKKGDYVDFPVSELSHGSNEKVKMVCDYCGSINDVLYSNFIKQTKIVNKCACRHCKNEKNRDLSFEKYGDRLFSRHKAKQTTIEKYGFESFFKTQEFKDKFKKTCMERYGVEHHLKSTIVQEEYKNKNLEKYGTEYFFQTDKFKEKYKESMMGKYGVENAFQSTEVKEKIKQTLLEKYGVEHISYSEEIQNKIKKNCMEKYGVDHIFKSEKIRKQHLIIAQHSNYIEYNSDTKTNLFKCDSNVEHNFNITSSLFHNRILYNLPLCTICYPTGDTTSIAQSQLSEFIENQIHLKIINNYRDGLEIDVFIPFLNIGFEFNGAYWHTEQYRDKFYHQNKTKIFKEKNIKLYHIWENDWMYKKEIVKSDIQFILGTLETIPIENIRIRQVTSQKSNEFLELNHIKGKLENIEISYGLFSEDKLMSILCLEMINNEWVLSRFCDKINTKIDRGTIKLLTEFITKYKPDSIIVYNDLDWSKENLYEQMGFKLIEELEPFEKKMKCDNEFSTWDCGKQLYQWKKSEQI